MRSIKKPTAYVLCPPVRIARPPQDASSQDSCKADTIVVPKHMQISMRRPLWRVITPYRYKGCVSCHSGDESVVVVVSCRSFFLLLSFSHSFSYVATRGLSFLRKIPQRTGCPRVIESPFRGSYSLRWFSYNSSVISLSLLAADSPCTENLFWRYLVETHVERQQVLFCSVIYFFVIVSFLINVNFEKLLSLFPLCGSMKSMKNILWLSFVNNWNLFQLLKLNNLF